MRIGVHVPQWGPTADRAGVLSVALAAESAGLDAIWVADHIVIPTTSASRYPYRQDGVPFGVDDGFLEALTTLSVVAGATERIGLGTSVLVMPMREPVLTGKAVATLDVLSGGRVTLAMGVGWWEEEFEALGARFSARGRRFDEQLEILRALWTDGKVAHSGEFYDFDELACLPLPVQTGGPPIWIGGIGEPAWRRAALFGAGWHAVGADLGTLAAGRIAIDQIALDAGRNPSEIALSTSTGAGRDTGRLLKRLGSLAQAGVDQVVLNLSDTSAEPMCEAVGRIGEMLPRLS